MINKRVISIISFCLIVLSACGMVMVNPCSGEERIVEILSAETGELVQGVWAPKNCFRKGETVFFKILVINRASVSKDAKITVTVYDSINQPIGCNYEEISLPEAIQTVRISIQAVYISIRIPTWAALGDAIAYVNALQIIEGFPFCPPYCPETSVDFLLNNPSQGKFQPMSVWNF